MLEKNNFFLCCRECTERMVGCHENAKNTPKPLRKTGNSESKLKRLVEIAKILYIGLKKKGANIENID